MFDMHPLLTSYLVTMICGTAVIIARIIKGPEK